MTPAQVMAARQAALVEVVPPPEMRESASAIAQTDRLIHQFAVRLQQPSSIIHMQANPDFASIPWAKDKSNTTDRLMGAIRVRIVPDTNLIELAIDHDVAGDDAPAIAEAIINQLITDTKTTAQNAMLDRSVMLNSLKNRYQFHKDDISRDLREKALQLSVDGMGVPGRPAGKERELDKLIDEKFELEQKSLEATSPEVKQAIAAQRKQLDDRISISRQDLGALINSTNQYLVLKADEDNTRELIKQVNEQRDQIVATTDHMSSELRWFSHPTR